MLDQITANSQEFKACTDLLEYVGSSAIIAYWTVLLLEDEQTP